MSSTAAEIAARIKLGLNIGNTLEAIGGETAWGNPLITQALIDTTKAKGFNAIRLPCSWDQYADPTTAKISDTWLNRVKAVVQYLTLFGFSSENWKRPASEVDDLMGLLRHYLRREIEELHKQGVKLTVIGERDRLGEDIVKLISDAEQRTAGNTRLHLNIALSYGSRSEIVAAARAAMQAAIDGRLKPEQLDEQVFESLLLTAGMPDPDLLIRTSGEKRISNFLLWQCAYAEFVFTDRLWPDFDENDFNAAIQEYHGRARRYGGAG